MSRPLYSETKGILWTLMVGVKDTSKLVVDEEVYRQMQIYYTG
jgi:hypothetical protein